MAWLLPSPGVGPRRAQSASVCAAPSRARTGLEPSGRAPLTTAPGPCGAGRGPFRPLSAGPASERRKRPPGTSARAAPAQPARRGSGCFRPQPPPPTAAGRPLGQAPQDPTASPSRGHNPPGRPAPSRPKAEVCPTLSSGEDPSRSPELHSTHRALLRARRSGRRHRAGVEGALASGARAQWLTSAFGCRPMRSAGRDFRLAAEQSSRRPLRGLGLVRILSHGIGLGLLPHRRGLRASVCRVASFQVRAPRGLGAAGRGGAPGLGRERTPSPDLELRGLGCSPPGWARRKIGFS